MSFKIRRPEDLWTHDSVIGEPVAVEVRCAGRCGHPLAEVYVDGTVLIGVGCAEHGLMPLMASWPAARHHIDESPIPDSTRTAYARAIATGSTVTDTWAPRPKR
jgi:hypothetical protein